MSYNTIQHILEMLEINFGHEWKILPSKPSDIEHHIFVVAIDPTKKLLTNSLELTNAVIVGTYKTTYQLLSMLQNDNLQIGYLSAKKNKDKVIAYEELNRAIRMILIDSGKEY